MSRLCEDCFHHRKTIILYGKDCATCELTNAIMVNETAQSCGLYNKDISNERICFNCKHFIGGADWGLACAKHYHSLPRALTEMCDDAEWKDVNNKPKLAH